MSDYDKSGNSIASGRADDARTVDFGLHYSGGSVPGELSRTRNEEDGLAVFYARLKSQYLRPDGDDLKWLNPGFGAESSDMREHAISPRTLQSSPCLAFRREAIPYVCSPQWRMACYLKVYNL